MSFQHYYPKNCPDCGIDLTHENSVIMFAANQEHLTSLDDNGLLLDVDRLIEHGQHQSTDCNQCGCNLADHEQERSVRGKVEKKDPQADLIRQSRSTHVLLIARCPGRKDEVLFDSGRAEESDALCDTALSLLEKRRLAPAT